MSPETLTKLLARLGPDLEALDEPWIIIGSSALIILGLPLADCQDLDILTTSAGAWQLEEVFAPWRVSGHLPDPSAPFRSRFSRYETAEGVWEVMGDLEVRTSTDWRPVVVAQAERRPFGSGAWPVPTAKEQERLLRLFGRPKDLAKARRLSTWLSGLN